MYTRLPELAFAPLVSALRGFSVSLNLNLKACCCCGWVALGLLSVERQQKQFPGDEIEKFNMPTRNHVTRGIVGSSNR
jgi:hypothetical protein